MIIEVYKIYIRIEKSEAVNNYKGIHDTHIAIATFFIFTDKCAKLTEGITTW